MSSTFFTAAPHWRWLIVAYFFLGGLAGGSYFLATMMDLFGKREDRPLVPGPGCHGGRRALGSLSSGLHRGAPRRHEPTDLGGHHAARTHLPDLGGVHVGGASDPVRFLRGRVAGRHPRARAPRRIRAGPRRPGHRGAGRVARAGRHGLVEWLGPPPGRSDAGRDRASSVAALATAKQGFAVVDRSGAGPPRWADPSRGRRLLLGRTVTNRWRRSFVILVVAGATLGCTSPEATRTRAGGPGADVGTHPRGAVQLHAGARMYYGTRIDGAGIGQHAFIGGAAGAQTRQPYVPRGIPPDSPHPFERPAIPGATP